MGRRHDPLDDRDGGLRTGPNVARGGVSRGDAMTNTYVRTALAPLVIAMVVFAGTLSAYLAGVAPKYVSDIAAAAIPITFACMVLMFMFETKIRRRLGTRD